MEGKFESIEHDSEHIPAREESKREFLLLMDELLKDVPGYKVDKGILRRGVDLKMEPRGPLTPDSYHNFHAGLDSWDEGSTMRPDDRIGYVLLEDVIDKTKDSKTTRQTFYEILRNGTFEKYQRDLVKNEAGEFDSYDDDGYGSQNPEAIERLEKKMKKLGDSIRVDMEKQKTARELGIRIGTESELQEALTMLKAALTQKNTANAA